MKKFLLLLIGTVMLLATAAFSGCDMVYSIEDIELVSSSEDNTYEVGSFDYGDYTFEIDYSDGRHVTVGLNESNLDDYNKMLVQSVGRHTITWTYDNRSDTFEVNIVLKSVSDDEEEQTVKPYLSGAEVTYDGQPHTLTVEGDIPSNATVYYPQGNTFTESGTYNISAKVVADGYSTISLSAQLIIKKAVFDMSGITFEPDYGTAENGQANTSFVYDGNAHEVTVKGSTPDGLSAPVYYIGEYGALLENCMKGNSATDAGKYTLYAVYSSTNKNYETSNLTMETVLVISKQKISNEFLDSLKFEDKTVVYDGKAHRLTISDITLPDGISVEYQDKSGKLFGSRTNVNEDGYAVFAKFISANENYEITNTLSATLYIMKADYLDPEDVTVKIDGNSDSIYYDDQPHSIEVAGLNSNVTVKQVLLNGISVSSDINSIPSVTDAGEYTYTIEFNPVDDNHNAIDPVERTVTVNKISFGNFTYSFDNVTCQFDGEGHGLSYQSYDLPVGVREEKYYYSDLTGEKIEGLPSGVTAVGTYQSYVKYSYNKNNYTNAPESVANATASLIITKRNYDAENIITMKDVSASFVPGKNNIELCTFDEALPSWIIGWKVIGYDSSNESTTWIENAGRYTYQFVFTYYDGTVNYDGSQIVSSSKSKLGNLRVIGYQISSSDYTITGPTSGIYDGVTKYIPDVTLNLPESVSPAYETVYEYSRYDQIDSGESIIVEKENYDAQSVCAGKHTFTYTFTAFNYEPLTVSIVTNVERQKKTASKLNYGCTDYSGAYDGENHANDQIVVLEKEEMIEVSPELISNVDDGVVAGTDIGVYTYKVNFSSTNPNYVIDASSISLTYTVTITSNEITDTFASCGSLFSLSDYEGIMLSREDGLMDISGDSPLNAFKRLDCSGNGGTSVALSKYETDFTYKNLTLLQQSLEDGLNGEEDDDTVNLAKLIDRDISGKSVVYLYDVSAGTLSDSVPLSEAGALVSTLKNAGYYYLIIDYCSENFLLDGLSGEFIEIHIKTRDAEIPVQKKVYNDEESDLSGESYSQFSRAVSGLTGLTSSYVTEIAAFESAKSVTYTMDFDGKYIKTNVVSPFKAMFNDQSYFDYGFEKFYLAAVKNDGSIVSWDGDDVLVLTEDTLLKLSSSDAYTQAASYYVFCDYGKNFKVGSSSRIVFQFNVLQINVTTVSDMLKVCTSGGGAEIPVSKTRKYITEKDSVVCTLDGNSVAVTGADAVPGTLTYFNDETVYEYDLTYSGSQVRYELLSGIDSGLKSILHFRAVYAGYKLSDGGLSVGELDESTRFTFNSCTADELSGKFLIDNSDIADDITSTGLYYLFIQFADDSVVLNGNTKFIICVKVDRNVPEEGYKLRTEGVTYDLDNTFSYSADYVYGNTIYSFGVIEIISGSENIANVGVIVGNTAFAYMFEYDVCKTYNEVFSYGLNSDEFAGYKFNINATITINTDKQMINVNDLLGQDLINCAMTIKYGDDYNDELSAKIKDKVKERITGRGYSEEIADALVQCLKIDVYDVKNYRHYFTYHIGSFSYNASPSFSHSFFDDKDYVFYADGYYTGSYSGSNYNVYVLGNIMGTLIIEKRDVYVYTGSVDSWEIRFNQNDAIEIEDLIDRMFLFHGFVYYDDDGNIAENKFASCFASEEGMMALFDIDGDGNPRDRSEAIFFGLSDNWDEEGAAEGTIYVYIDVTYGEAANYNFYECTLDKNGNVTSTKRVSRGYIYKEYVYIKYLGADY